MNSLDWRSILAEEEDPDDDELNETPPDVVAVLGFDPAEEDEETEPEDDSGAIDRSEDDRQRYSAIEFLWEERQKAAPGIPLALSDPQLARDAEQLMADDHSYDPAAVVSASYEEFSRRGEVEKYRQWQAEKYKKSKPAKGQMGFDWKEDDHPRNASGEFAEKGEGESHGSQRADVSAHTEGPAQRNPESKLPAGAGKTESSSAATAEEKSLYQDYLSRMQQWKQHPRTVEQWLDNYREVQKRKGPEDVPPQQAERAEETSAAESPPEDTTADFSLSNTPREAAAAATKKQIDDDYAFARSSAVPNAGEDVLRSARHTRNAWRGLEEAEADGSAAELVTREKLLKNEPHKLMVHVTRNPLTVLAMHYALRNFPAKPGYGSGRPSPEDAQKNRRQYLDAYQRIKTKAEDLAGGEDDPVKASRELATFVESLRKEYYGCWNTDPYMSMVTATDRFNATANALHALSSKLGRSRHKLSIDRQTAQFAKAFQEKYRTMAPREKVDQLADNVGDILEGASTNKTLGIEGGNKEQPFRPADLYVKIAERQGGPEIPSETAAKATAYMLEKQQFRGLQFGNSMTDEEREYHVRKCAEAFADLSDILGIPEDYTSWKGRLAIAFGARGKANAGAHYEPDLAVINLTRKSGVGSLAHEWGHFFDHQLAGAEIPESTRSGSQPLFFTGIGSETRERKEGKTTRTDNTHDPLWQAFDKLEKIWQSSGFNTRMNTTLSEMIRAGRISEEKRSYWRSPLEVFARTFERYVQQKLEADGRRNTYLAGIETKGHKEGGLWPTNDEVEAMTPAFDAIFEEFRGGIEKGRYWLRESGERVVLERSR